MAKNRRKSAAIALAVIGIAGLSLASASQLDLTGGTLQAGTTDLTDCQPSGTPVVAEMSAGTFVAGTGYEAGDVSLTGIAAACTGKQIEAVLLDAGGNALTTSASAAIGGASATVSVPAGISAGSVEGIAVVISDN
ncbi:MAG: hypothetical protein KQH57_15750 [Actinomycetales bacterium]|nr:hypothetical protein [Actinomycetales bacterium]